MSFASMSDLGFTATGAEWQAGATGRPRVGPELRIAAPITSPLMPSSMTDEGPVVAAPTPPEPAPEPIKQLPVSAEPQIITIPITQPTITTKVSVPAYQPPTAVPTVAEPKLAPDTMIFSDGFESGHVTRWSGAVDPFPGSTREEVQEIVAIVPEKKKKGLPWWAIPAALAGAYLVSK